MDTASTESLLTSGQDTTAAAADQATADTTTATSAPAAADKPAETQAGPAAKAEDGKTPEGDKAAAAKDGDKPAGAPETYAAFTMPEGYALDEQLLGEFTPVMKELGLSQEAAQKVMDFAPKLVERTVAETQAAFLEQTGLKDYASWPAASKADPEFGGEKLAENLGIANKALGVFATPALRALLKSTGLANHPDMIRAFYRVGKNISEDSFMPGGKTTSPNTATSLYDKSQMNP